jgi:hypothetical protein
MWRSVALVRTRVSDERIATIIRVKRITDLRTTSAVTSNSNTLLVTADVVPDCLCGPVVRVPGCCPRGSRIDPSATTFSEKQWVWNGVDSAS